MACGNCFSFLTMESRPLVELQRSPCDESAPLDMIECGKKGSRRVSSRASTAADSGSSSGSDTDTGESTDDTIDKSHVEPSGKFPCPHCFQKFDTQEALDQHDTCMVMPSDMASTALSGDSSLESVGLKLD